MAWPAPGREATPAAGPAAAAGRPLLCLVHLTDVQLADVQSPTRCEFLNRYFADPRYAEIIPVQRPQEALTAHAVDAMLRTVNALHGPATGAPLRLAVTTGDAIDNAQWNELQAFLALLDGGPRRRRAPAAPATRGSSRSAGRTTSSGNRTVTARAGPTSTGASSASRTTRACWSAPWREFHSDGLDLPWLSCFGNHEALNQGVGRATPGIADALVGSRKPVALPGEFDHDRVLELFTEQPEAFMAGPARAITADPARRPITRRDFVEAHFLPGARPEGHGFGMQNLLDGTADYVHDTAAVRLIALDTNCLAGGAAGCLGRQQARWLQARLAEVHSAYRGPGGEVISTGHEDRLAVVFSHHGTGTLTNTRHPGPGGEPLLSGADVLAILHRFPNLVLWLNGHTHINRVEPRRDPADPARGFWEVTTCSIADWPCQTRLVELVDCGGHLSIVCTMVDHDTPPVPASLETGDDLAALHRELAANAPLAGAGSAMAGAPPDRNVELRLRLPFPLSRLAGE